MTPSNAAKPARDGTPAADAALLSDLADLFGDALDDEFGLVPFDAADPLTEDLLAPSEELGRVSRRIAGQYVGILARHAATAFGRRGAGADGNLPVHESIDALARLANASGDDRQAALLLEVRALLPGLDLPRQSRQGQRAIAALQEWIPRFAETLELQDAKALLDLVHWERGSMPLLDELATIRGIGRRRLARLYAAGLFSVDVVANAPPDEVVQVTGLPRALALEVIERTRKFAEEERRRCLEEMRDRAHRLNELARSFRFDDADSVHKLAAEALSAVELALHDLTTRSTP